MSTTVGCRLWTLPDPGQDDDLKAVLLYPAENAERLEPFGPYSLAVARDAPVVGDHIPLIVISHGNAASPWTLRDAGAALARAGFVVCLLEHTGNSRSNNTLERTEANLINRPRHVSLAIEAVFADAEFGPRIVPDVGILGLSIGAYTALAAAGGRA